MIRNQEAVGTRARAVAGHDSRNGIRLVLVADVLGDAARLHLHFLNGNHLAELVDNPAPAHEKVRISGGHRAKAGPAAGQVRATAVAQPDPDEPVLEVTVAPVGDYSTYTLAIDALAFPAMDPLFNEIEFRFRPGCFDNCPPDWDAPRPAVPAPAIDYLAKDFDGFKHTLIGWMSERVPGWQPTSEADLDQVLIELFSAAADELSDFQDRVMNEAYLATARKRLSLARHARLVDYHVHQGAQAGTWLALEVDGGGSDTIQAGSLFAAGEALTDRDAVPFVAAEDATAHPSLNGARLYTWSGAIPALAAGSVSADLELDTPGQTAATEACDLIREGRIRRLLLQEHLDPATGREAGRDPRKRQLLRLLDGDEGAEAAQDPVTGRWYVRVRWDDTDRLRHDYCFLADCPGGPEEKVSLFHGNLVRVNHGEPVFARFKPRGESLAVQVVPGDPVELHYSWRDDGAVLCALPKPVLYRQTPPGGLVPPVSTVATDVTEGLDVLDGSIPDEAGTWRERISLVHSDGSDRHFVVETDEERRSVVRFGNGVNGAALPPDAVVECRYQAGQGADGNVGADAIVAFDEAEIRFVQRCWNPFDVTDGREPEPRAQVLRRAPEAYRQRQQRAVTLADHVQRARELPGVAGAAARYMWTGSWRTVRVTVDPVGTDTLSPELARRVAEQLDAVRMLGEDVEVRAPVPVPLEIRVRVCADAEHWPEDVRFRLEREFSDGYAPDGTRAFFHPDRWTFGQALRASQILGRMERVPGVDHVVELSMRRRHQGGPATDGVIDVAPHEIIQVRNDPDHMELGSIRFQVVGGRR